MKKEDFLNSDNKAVTLMGMSGVGKTYLADKLRDWGWYHYSCDVEIGTNILKHDIVDTIKQDILANPSLRKFLETGAIQINNNIDVKNLDTLSAFIGQLGNPVQGRIGNIEHGGIDLKEFKRRQRLYFHAEGQSLLQVENKIRSAKRKGFQKFVNDSTGSMCEMEDETIFEALDESTLIIYIKATDEDIENVKRRAQETPKPLLYPADKFDDWLARYMKDAKLKNAADIEPDEFSRQTFEWLLEHRMPRYDRIAEKYGITISSDDLGQVESEQDFFDLIKAA